MRYTIVMKEYLGLLAGILALIGHAPYLVSVIRGKTTPHPLTWLSWSIVTTITFMGQLVKGGGYGTLATGLSGLFTIFIFFYSLKYGFQHVRHQDTYFFLASLTGVIIWILTHEPTYAVIIAVSVDIIAFIPTLRKTWHKPSSEIPILYATNIAKHFLILLALGAYNIATTLHSIVMLFTNTLMILFIFRNKLTSIKAP